jgi:hypothetical protein
MGQFKPMVKMMTTEPTIELKLKKGGKVSKKADGGMMGAPMGAPDLPPAMPARGGMPMAGAPMKPSLAMRRRAMKGMPAGAGPAGPIGGAASMQPSMPMAPPAMKKGGKAEGGKMDTAQDKAMIKKAFKQHDMQEHKGGKGTKLTLKKGGKAHKYATGGAIPSETSSGDYATTKMYQAKADSAKGTGGVKEGNGGGFKKGGKVKMAMGGMMDGGMMDGAYKKGGMAMAMKDGKKVPAFLAKKMATGGVVKGQAGYATGGMIPSESTSGSPATTIVDTARYDNAPANTGGVRNGNAGGFKKGGATKKRYATGGSVNSTGSAVAMPQGRKPASKPVAINELAGTYKRGGRVAPGNRALQAVSQKENAPAIRAAKAMSNEKYGPASLMKLKEGGNVDLSKGAYDKAIGPSDDDMDMARSIRGFPGKVFDKVKGAAKELFSTMPKTDSVTKTKESVTVTPGKKRGGSVNC